MFLFLITHAATEEKQGLVRPEPIVPCRLPTAIWLEDGIRCRVRFAEWSRRKTIRNARFDGLLIDESQQQQQQP